MAQTGADLLRQFPLLLPQNRAKTVYEGFISAQVPARLSLSHPALEFCLERVGPERGGAPGWAESGERCGAGTRPGGVSAERRRLGLAGPGVPTCWIRVCGGEYFGATPPFGTAKSSGVPEHLHLGCGVKNLQRNEIPLLPLQGLHLQY